ncbi:hypothetical protein ACQR3P_02100 [Rhodococcus sp. IEGM1300]
MNFTTTVMPGVRAFASTLRVKLCRERLASARACAPFTSPSFPAKAQPRAHWRVCPMTGQLQQRWSMDDSQDPQSWSIARMLLGLNLGTYSFN